MSDLVFNTLIQTSNTVKFLVIINLLIIDYIFFELNRFSSGHGTIGMIAGTGGPIGI